MKRCMIVFLMLYVQLFAQYGSQSLQDWLDTELPMRLETMKKSDLAKLTTKVFNVIRISWENPSEFEIFKKDDLSVGSMITANLQKRALLKARKFLLGLQKHQSYSKQSSVQLAIALSYYLENQLYAFDDIVTSIQRWQEYGAEIPKNLVKMTSYEESIATIAFLKKVSRKKDIELLELITIALQENSLDLIGVSNSHYQSGYDWMEFGINAKDFVIASETLGDLLSTQWIIPFKRQYFVVASKKQ